MILPGEQASPGASLQSPRYSIPVTTVQGGVSSSGSAISSLGAQTVKAMCGCFASISWNCFATISTATIANVAHVLRHTNDVS